MIRSSIGPIWAPSAPWLVTSTPTIIRDAPSAANCTLYAGRKPPSAIFITRASGSVVEAQLLAAAFLLRGIAEASPAPPAPVRFAASLPGRSLPRRLPATLALGRIVRGGLPQLVEVRLGLTPANLKRRPPAERRSALLDLLTLRTEPRPNPIVVCSCPKVFSAQQPTLPSRRCKKLAASGETWLLSSRRARRARRDENPADLFKRTQPSPPRDRAKVTTSGASGHIAVTSTDCSANHKWRITRQFPTRTAWVQTPRTPRIVRQKKIV